MKKVLLMLVVLAVLVIPTNADFYLTGDWEGWSGGGVLMTDNLDGTYSGTVTGLTADSFHEFKVTQGDWGWSTPSSGNSWFYADGLGEIGVTFTPSISDGWLPGTNRIGLSTDTGSWSIVGDLNGWNNADAAWQTTDSGGGIYTLTKSLTAGTYNWKAVNTGTWQAVGNDGYSVNADNIELALAGDSDVMFSVDPLSGAVKAEIIPEPATMLLLGLGSWIAIRRRK